MNCAVVVAPGSAPAGASVPLDITPAEFCFFTLVLRHSRDPARMRRSLALLQAASAAEFTGLTAHEAETGRALLSRFAHETEDAILSVRAEQYIARALSTDLPRALSLGAAAPPPDVHALRVLDPRCVRVVDGDPAGFLGGDQTASMLTKVAEHPTTRAMAASIKELGLGPQDQLVLSLSGGVDSMAHAVMLTILQPRFQYGESDHIASHCQPSIL